MTDWKPGDVAMVSHRDEGVIGVGLFHVLPSGQTYWQLAERLFSADGHRVTARPLAVIDPENWSLMLELTQRMQVHQPGANITGAAERLQAALREFAAPTPPKPAEPTGLGAVVEDAAGGMWIRHRHSKRPWQHASQPTNPCHWDEIGAVRVLSEGVTE